MLTFNGTIIAVLINFGIMLFIVQRFLFKPITKILDEREHKIKSELSQSEEHLAGAKNDREQSERILKEARQQAQQILDGAKKENERLRVELSTQLQAELEQLRQRTQSALTQERQALLDQWRKESAALVTMASEKILQQVMDPALHVRLQSSAQQKLNEKEMVLA